MLDDTLTCKPLNHWKKTRSISAPLHHFKAVDGAKRVDRICPGSPGKPRQVCSLGLLFCPQWFSDIKDGFSEGFFELFGLEALVIQ